MVNSGKIANKNGTNLEETIDNILRRHSYEEVDKNRFMSVYKNYQEPIFAKQVTVGKTIYNTQRKCDFILFHPIKFSNGLIIECKWQQSPGSVDEKYPFLVLNIDKLSIDTIIIIDGDGYKKGAKDWLKMQTKNFSCLKKVVSIVEFLTLANSGYL